MDFINLTPHAIAVFRGGEVVRRFPPSGQVARLSYETESEAYLDGFNVRSVRFEGVRGLPEPRAATVYLVSSLISQFAKRPDVLAPDRLVRNDAGQIIGCEGFASHLGSEDTTCQNCDAPYDEVMGCDCGRI